MRASVSLVRAAAAGQGPRPQRHPDLDPVARLPLLRRPGPAAARPRGPADDAQVPRLATRASRCSRTSAASRRRSLGVILRAIVTIEQEGADDLLRRARVRRRRPRSARPRTARGIVTLLEVADVMDRPRLYSTFVLWMLAQLYETLPEVGDLPKPKLAFFFDEAHLLFTDASEAADGADRAHRAAHPVQGRRRLLRDPGADRRARRPSCPSSATASSTRSGRSRPDDADALRKTARTFPVTDALRRRADDHLAGHRRGARHRAVTQGHPDAARGDPARPARLADGAAHRRGARRELSPRRRSPPATTQSVDPQSAHEIITGAAREREGRRRDGRGRGDDARRRVADDRGRARDDDARRSRSARSRSGRGSWRPRSGPRSASARPR